MSTKMREYPHSTRFSQNKFANVASSILLVQNFSEHFFLVAHLLCKIGCLLDDNISLPSTDSRCPK